MSPEGSREKDILLMLFAVQLSIVGLNIPELFPLAMVGGLVFASVLVNEAIRRFNEHARP